MPKSLKWRNAMSLRNAHANAAIRRPGARHLEAGARPCHDPAARASPGSWKWSTARSGPRSTGRTAGRSTTGATTSCAPASGCGCEPDKSWWSSPGAATRRHSSTGIRRQSRAPRRRGRLVGGWRALRSDLRSDRSSSNSVPPARPPRPVGVRPGACPACAAAAGADNSRHGPPQVIRSTTSSATGSWTWRRSASRSAATRRPA